MTIGEFEHRNRCPCALCEEGRRDQLAARSTAFEPTCQLRFARSAGTSTLPDTLQQFWRRTWIPTIPTQGILNDLGAGEWRDVPVEII